MTAPDRDHDDFARQLRGFGAVGIAAIGVVIAGHALLPPLGALLALVWARRSGTPWRELGFSWSSHAWLEAAAGVALGALFKLAMKSVVMPLLGAPPVNAAFQHLSGNAAALPGILFAVVVYAGFGEETLFRGYAFERLGRALGPQRWAPFAIVAGTSVVFGAIHYPEQGLPGAQQATVVGLAFGTVYAATRRLWPLILAHASFDVTAVALIYWNLEARVAQWFFR